MQMAGIYEGKFCVRKINSLGLATIVGPPTGGGGLDVNLSNPCRENTSVTPNITRDSGGDETRTQNLCGKISREESR